MSSYIRRYNSKGPELLIDMVSQVAEVLSTNSGLQPAAAEALALVITNKMAQTWGGQFIYFPKGTWNGGALSCFQVEERNRQIEIEFNGNNREEICAKYRISQRRLYQILTAIRLARRNSQP